MHFFKTLSFLFLSVVIIGCNTDDTNLSEDDLVGTWVLTERITTNVFLVDPITGEWDTDTLSEINGLHTLTFNTNGVVVRVDQMSTHMQIDSGEINAIDGGYEIDLNTLDGDFTFDLINSTTLHLNSSYTLPVCGEVINHDVYTKVGN